MPNTINYYQLIADWLTPQISTWFTAQCQEPAKKFYLFYLKSTACDHGKICIASEVPGNDWALANSSPVSCAWTKEIAHYNLMQWTRSLPILKP